MSILGARRSGVQKPPGAWLRDHQKQDAQRVGPKNSDYRATSDHEVQAENAPRLAPVPKARCHGFENVKIGDRRELGSNFTFTADLIKKLALQFDPQPFHLDEDAGRNSVFQGLAASG